MGGVRANPTPKDTTKKHTKPRVVKGKVKLVETKPIEGTMKMGEVSAEPVNKEIQKPQKSKPKK
jgi:hypothetical protein